MITVELLRSYRDQVQPAWTAETAHPGFPGEAASPVGQCGVTSAWLQQRLADDHGIHSSFLHGTLAYIGGFADHCWLTVGGQVVDLTASQFGLPEIVYGAPDGIRYAGRPSLWPVERLRLLRINLGEMAA